MSSVIVPPVDLAPGMPSRVVTISATDVTEGGKSLEGQMVRFALSDTLDVSSGGDVIAKTQAEVVLDANGEGSIRLPVYDENVKTWCGQDWAILVTATWGSQKAIRVPDGTTSIALSALPPVRPLRGREKLWAITGASVSVTSGATWDIDVALNGGILDFDFTVPPGGVAWQRGELTIHADGLRLQADEGMYRVPVAGSPATLGVPWDGSGTLWVEWIRGNYADTSYARQTGIPSENPSMEWKRQSSPDGWTAWERTDATGVAETGQILAPRDLPAGADADALKLRQHTGPWRVGDSGTASTITGLPDSAGTLWVQWVRGNNVETSVATQRYDSAEGVALHRVSSSTAGWSPWEERSGGGSVAIEGGVTRVDVVIAAGQSNMSGRGTPFGPGLDDTDSRVWEFGSKDRSLRVASVPLDMHDANGAAGLSPATVFARKWAHDAGPGVVTLLVPAARGATGFDPTATWNWATESGPSSLREAMREHLAEAITAARAEWPDATVTVRAMLWHQGENTAEIDSVQDYITALSAVITDVRTAHTDTPVIVGELSPDREGGVSGTVSGQAHQVTPFEVARTALAHTRPNGSREGDLTHLARTGVEQLGTAMYEAHQAAVANAPGILVAVPHRVWAWQDGSSVHAEWVQPLCRVTGYMVEAHVDGAWTSVPNVGRRATAPAGTTHVRVATVGESATSRWTAPVPVSAPPL